ncbi:uncharacterized protein LOC113506027 [Trichoplusia ni]|uniref:Uncharacterized protein LOC113506027 n=1 Tax=Trichoplusia ni TaxID=7111 RepID=A0A7E5WWZ5_TRINI|nr:uncharacterized protein LOC113506027 [Trichoplusia ni]
MTEVSSPESVEAIEPYQTTAVIHTRDAGGTQQGSVGAPIHRGAEQAPRQRAPDHGDHGAPAVLHAVVSSLFPERTNIVPPVVVAPQAPEPLEAITEGEMEASIACLRPKKTAPGPDGVPARALTLALGPLESRFRGLLNSCLEEGRFPDTWKTGRLVLLRKEGRPADSPSGYRPVVLLDEAGKLFERIIAARIVRHLERTGPSLSDCQYGFRARRSTVDAIKVVQEFAADAVARGGVAVAVSLDIANAFNSLPHQCIETALRYHGGGSVKLETAAEKSTVSSKKASVPSTTKSFEVRKKQLELEAAEAIANIQKDIIQKKLAADLAALEEECSQKSRASCTDSAVSASQKVEQWLEHSQHDRLRARASSPCPQNTEKVRFDNVILPSVMVDKSPPTDIQQLAQAIKDIAVASSSSTNNAQMLLV